MFLPSSMQNTSEDRKVSKRKRKIRSAQSQQISLKSLRHKYKQTLKKPKRKLISKKSSDKVNVKQHTKADVHHDDKKCKAGPRVFKLVLTRNQWKKIKVTNGWSNLHPPWTDALYKQFVKNNPSCTLSFKYQHVKKSFSRKKNSPFFHAYAKYYYSLLKTSIKEIMAGNIAGSLTKDILKKISSEMRKSTRLYNDVLLELMLTQKVIKETCSQSSSKGYFQLLQIDPLAVNLYTDTGVRSLAEHLKQSSYITLHPDATGSVVHKNPRSRQAGFILCFSFARYGQR